MARALDLARRGLCSASPNPRVGCVLTHGDQVIAEGWHEYTGGPHAEQQALQQAGPRAKGATCYVTLEPCAHQGKTPPCADLLLEAGIAELIAAIPDPDPRTQGKGLARLRQGGVKVSSGLMADQARDLNIGFFSRCERRRPWLTCKLATSLDGRSAAADGDSRWISSPAARRDVQRLRARSCAILTGSGTAQDDRPRLTVRAAHGAPLKRQPLRVVLDRRLRLAPDSPMLKEPGRTLVLTTSTDPHKMQTLQAQGAELKTLPRKRFLHNALRHLADREQINEILVEAGPTLCGSLIQEDLVDRLILYLAPRFLGDQAHPLLHLPGITGMRQALPLQTLDLRQVGPDFRLTLRIPTQTQTTQTQTTKDQTTKAPPP